MYHVFYEKFLHQAYTAVDPKNYLANWFLEQLKTSGDRRWAVIEEALAKEETDRPQRRQRLEQEKAQKRERRAQAAEAMRGVQPLLQKIAWNGSAPVYLDRIDADNHVIATRIVRGRRLAPAAINPADIMKIDEMPAAQLPALQKLVGLLQKENITPQFHGTPPDGWDQTTDDPLASIDDKIAYVSSYGPVYCRNYDDYYDEVNYWYFTRSGLQSGYSKSDRVKPIDQMPPDQMPTLRKLIKKVKEQNGPFTPQFYGNPPAGWEQTATPHQAEGKFAWHRDYGPVYVKKSEEGESSCYYWDYDQGAPVTLEDSEIEQIDRMPQSYMQNLVKLLDYAKQYLGVANPAFFGTPPAGLNAMNADARQAVGKVAAYNNMAVYVVRVNGEHTDVLAMAGQQVLEKDAETSQIKPFQRGTTSTQMRESARVLITALYEQRHIRAQLWVV